MFSYPSIVAVALAAGAGTLTAAEPGGELDEALAVKLINLQLKQRAGEIRIATIRDGSSTSDCGTFHTNHVRRVTAVHPVPEEGRRVRRVRTYDFFWSPTYGWYAWEKREERGGEAIWIWSEILGETVVR